VAVTEATDAKSLGLRFLQAFWSGKLEEEGYPLCAPDARWTFQKTLHEPRVVPVREAVEFLVSALIGGFDPDSGYTVDVDNLIGEGDEAAIEYRAQGKTRTGEVYANNYLVRFTARDGKLVSIRPYFDTHLVSKLLFDLDRRKSPYEA
jgi:ketosteroid isomerase-like protein